MHTMCFAFGMREEKIDKIEEKEESGWEGSLRGTCKYFLFCGRIREKGEGKKIMLKVYQILGGETMADKLTVKQEKFVQGLFAGMSQREAYIAAYNTQKMSNNAIDVEACKLAANPKISQRLTELQDEFKERNFVTVERTLQEYARLGYFDPRKFFNADGSPKPIHELDDDTAAALAGFEVMEVWEGHGENREFVGYLKKFKLPDKRAALDSIAKYLGLFVDRHEVTGKDGGPIQTESKPDLSKFTVEELKQLAELSRKAAGPG